MERLLNLIFGPTQRPNQASSHLVRRQQDSKEPCLVTSRSQKTVRTYTPVLSASGNSCIWVKGASRLSPGLDSVLLEPHVKTEIIDDLNAHLAPYTDVWYADRGIPYLRNYLFYGVAVCEKTTCATALAGYYGRDIYTLSVLDPNINDPILLQLLTTVRPKAVILIEDIDSVPPRPSLYQDTQAQPEAAQSRPDSEEGPHEAGIRQDQGYAVKVQDDPADDEPRSRAESQPNTSRFRRCHCRGYATRQMGS